MSLWQLPAQTEARLSAKAFLLFHRLGSLQMLINVLLSAGIVYCVACYAITLLSSTFCQEEEDETDEKIHQCFRAAWKQSPIYMFLATLFILVPLFFVLIPLIIPFCAVLMYLEDRKAAAELRKHSDYQFAWTNQNDLPDETRKFFGLRTPELLELGFQLDGVYLMKPKPQDYYGALFINESGTTVASLTKIFDNFSCSFSSILESGRCIETSPTEATPDLLRFADHPRYATVFVPDETIRSGYQRHQEKLSELYWTTDDRFLVFEPEQICDVLQYEGRVFSEVLFELGDRDEAPPAAVLPPALPLAWKAGPLFAEPGTSEAAVQPMPRNMQALPGRS